MNAITLAIIEKEAEIAEVQSQIDNFEYESSESEYDEFLDSFGDVEICGHSYLASRALKLIDPIAYRCGKVDYDSSVDIEELDEFQDLWETLEKLKSELFDLNMEAE